MRTRIAIATGDLTRGDELVLVNASNTGAWLGSGVSGAIARACGDAFQDDIIAAMKARFGGEMEPGQVLITDAGAHRSGRYVAHVAVMDYRSGIPGGHAAPDAARLALGFKNLWDAISAIRNPGLSIALPALGAGTGGLGVRLPTEIACRTLLTNLREHPEEIERVVFYGYAPHEQLVIAEVVSAAFGPAVEMPSELREHLH